MAQGGNVRKGFTIYLLILFFIILAALLGCIVAMLFSPFTNILGLQYYVYNYSDIFKETDAGQAYNLDNISVINVDTNSANVILQRRYDVDQLYIEFTATSKGFAKADQNTDFNHYIEYDETAKALNISVHEPEGFIRFENNVNINLLLPMVDASEDFDNIDLYINTNTGNIYIGNNATDDLNPNLKYDTKIKNLYITMNDGSLRFAENSTNEFENLRINIGDGRVTSDKDISFSNSLSINSNSARFDLANLSYTSTMNHNMHINLNLDDAIFYADSIIGNLNLNMRGGHFIVDGVEGSINSNSAITQMSNGRITIGSVAGNISLPYANNSDITIDSMTEGSQAYIHATGGNITINSLKGMAWLETTSGKVDVTTYSDGLEIITTSGAINLVYDVDTVSDVVLKSNSGRINAFVRSNLSCVMKFHDKDGIYYDDDNGPSTVNLILHDIGFQNPAIINNGLDANSMLFYSNGRITVDLIETTAL